MTSWMALGAVGEHHGQFGARSEAGRFGIQQEGADAVAGGCSAGLAGDDMGQILRGEPGG